MVNTIIHVWLNSSNIDVRSIAVNTYLATSRNHFPNSCFMFMLQIYIIYPNPPSFFLELNLKYQLLLPCVPVSHRSLRMIIHPSGGGRRLTHAARILVMRHSPRRGNRHLAQGIALGDADCSNCALKGQQHYIHIKAFALSGQMSL